MESKLFISLLVERESQSAGRLGITVTRKVGKAVQRNRIKRLVREWYRLRSEELGARDLVVIAKRSFPKRIALGDVVQDLDRVSASWRRQGR